MNAVRRRGAFARFLQQRKGEDNVGNFSPDVVGVDGREGSSLSCVRLHGVAATSMVHATNWCPFLHLSGGSHSLIL